MITSFRKKFTIPAGVWPAAGVAVFIVALMAAGAAFGQSHMSNPPGQPYMSNPPGPSYDQQVDYREGLPGPRYHGQQRSGRETVMESHHGRDQMPRGPHGSMPRHAWQMEGMVRIGYDLDSDGVLDTFEYIPYYELQAMRQRSQERGQQQAQTDRRFQSRRGMPQQGPARGYFEERRPRPPAARERFDSVEGRIREMQTIGLAEMDEKHVVARIETRDGRIARVDLGPEKKIRELDLRQDDRVRILGTPGTIDNRPYLTAHYVNTDQQQVRINRPQDKGIRNYTGRILKTKPARFGDRETDNLMARVRLGDGTTTIVNLGPEKALKKHLDVTEGKSFHMLARPALIEGKQALVAEALSIGGKTYDVQWDKE